MPVANTLRRACEIEVSRQHNVVAGQQPQTAIEQTYYVNYFISWKTKSPDEAFAQDYPRAALAEMAAEAEPGRVGMHFPEAAGFNLLAGPYDW